jgi:hypothetical protein
MQTRGVYIVVLAALLGSDVRSQSLSIASSTAKAGSTGSFLLKLAADRAMAPVGLQWKFSFPRGISVVASDILIGSAAESAHKVLVCALDHETKSRDVVIFNCVLAGGKAPIAAGTIATVRYQVAGSAPAGPSRIGVDHALAVSAELTETSIALTGGVILVQ